MGKRRLELHTETFTVRREWTAEGVPVLEAELALPEPAEGRTRLGRRIARYYRWQSRACLRWCQRQLLPGAEAECRAALENSAPLPRFRAELTYRVTWNGGGLWSLYTQLRETGFSGPPLLRRWGDVWDLNAGCPVELSAFFPAGSPWRRELPLLAAEEARRREAAGVSRYREKWRRELRRRFNPQNYYLTPEGVVFFYPQYAVAPASEGIPAFTVPFGVCGCRLPEGIEAPPVPEGA